jgi:hypothetical protein
MTTQTSPRTPSQNNANQANSVFQEQGKMYKHRAVGAFQNYEVTEVALRELSDSGFSMNRVSVVGRDIYQHPDFVGAHTDDHVVSDTNQTKAETGALTGTAAGTAVGGLTGLLVGLGVVAIPGVGPVMLAGAAATALVTAISGGVLGAAAGSLVGGLIGLEIPADRAKAYSDRVSQGDYLVIVEGSEADIVLAGSILGKHGVHDWYTYDSSAELAANTVN